MKLECEKTCPFAKMCGQKVGKNEANCVQNITKAMPGATNLIASLSNETEVAIMSGNQQIGKVNSGTLFRYT